MQLCKPRRAQARSGVDNASLVPAAFSLCSQPSFFHPFPQERQRTLNCKHLLHTSSSGLARPKRRAMLGVPVGNFSPKPSAPVPTDGSKTAARIKEFNLQTRSCRKESLLFSRKASAATENLQSQGEKCVISQQRARRTGGGKTPNCANRIAAPCARSDCRTSGWILEGERIQDGRKD